MSENLPASKEWPQTCEEIKDVLQRAEQGDETVLAQVRNLLTCCPELVDALGGDLEQITERLLSSAVAGENLAFREAIKERMRLFRQELAGPNATPLERLLVARIVACWLQVQTADIAATQATDISMEAQNFHRRRQDSANRRYLAAIKTLATVRKLGLPALQVNIGQNQVNVAGGGDAGE